jgi:hypothetical protein
MLMKASFSYEIGYLTTSLFKQLKGLSYEVAKIHTLALAILNMIADVGVTVAE